MRSGDVLDLAIGTAGAGAAIPGRWSDERCSVRGGSNGAPQEGRNVIAEADDTISPAAVPPATLRLLLAVLLPPGALSFGAPGDLD